MANFRWEFEASGQNSARGMVAILSRLETITTVLINSERRLAGIQNILTQEFSRLTTVTNTTNTTINNSTTIINNFGSRTQGVTRHVDTLFQRMTKAAQIWNVWNAAISFTKTRFQELSGVIGGVMNVGMGFESQSATLKGLLDNYQPVIDKAKELGATTKFSATESAAGAVELAKAGMTSQQIIDSLGATLQAAEANGISVGQAGKVAAVGMNQFTRSGESAAEILQIYTAAANASSTDILPLSAAMKNAAGTASLLGLNAAKTATFMALMGSKGIEAGAAGTQLKIALTNLSAVTPRAQKALDKLGIDVKSLNLADPVSWLTVFSEKLKAVSSDAERIALIKPIMGEAVTGLLPILMEGGDAFKKMFDQISGSTSKMAEMQQAQAATIGGALAGMQSAAEGVMLGIYDVIKVPVAEWFRTWQQAFTEIGNRLNEVAKRFADSKGGIQEWINTMKTEGVSGLFEDLLNDLEPQIDQLKSIVAAAWETIKALIREGFKSIFTSDVADLLKRQAIDIFKAAWEEIKKIPEIGGMATVINKGRQVGSAVGRYGDTLKDEGQIVSKYWHKPFSATYKSAQAISGIFENNDIWKQQGEQQLSYLGKLEAKKRLIERIPLMSRTEEDTRRLQNINKQILIAENEIKKLAQEYQASGNGELVTQNAYFNSVATRNTRPETAEEPETIARMKYAERKAIKNEALLIEGGTRYEQQITKEGFLAQGMSTRQADYLMAQQRAKAKSERDVTNQDENSQRLAYVKWARTEQDKYRDYQRRGIKPKDEYSRVEETSLQTQEEIKAAQERLAAEKEIYELKKKEAETQAQIANAPIDLKMQQNATNTGFSKWLLEPMNKFREAMSGVIGKFMGVFEGLGKQRTEAGVKSGRLTEEGAKKESAQVLEGSVTRAQKMLKLAQTPGQKAEAMQTQAEKLMQISELTGDKSKAKQADDLLKRAQTEQGKQESVDLRKVELDQKLAKDNMKLLEGKKDGSASEAAARLKQLMESAMELGDVEKASQFKTQLQEAERKAAGEQVGVLKQILQELQLSRKSNDLAMTEQTDAMKQGTAQQVDKLTAIQNNSGGYDTALMQPA